MKLKDSIKSMVDKMVEESLMASNYMKKLLNNITIIAVETKKLTDHVLTMNSRLNKHEEIILRLVNQSKESHDSNESVVKQQKDPMKLN